jgi:hypothetical protein
MENFYWPPTPIPIIELLATDPKKQIFLNNGVSSIRKELYSNDFATLLQELKTFVCEGNYEKGLLDIIDVAIRNIDDNTPPYFFISGIYGSGKTHLSKMLRAFWDDPIFPDRKSARTIPILSKEVKKKLDCLSKAGYKIGGLRSVSASLLDDKDEASAYLKLARLIINAPKTPLSCHAVQFAIWLKTEGYLEKTQELITKTGLIWTEEFQNLHDSPIIYDLMSVIFPKKFKCPLHASEELKLDFRIIINPWRKLKKKIIKEALEAIGKRQLTLIVLDDVERYVEGNPTRSEDLIDLITDLYEADNKLMLVLVGDYFPKELDSIKHLFSRVELSDEDQNTVIRKLLLAKDPKKVSKIHEKVEAESSNLASLLKDTSFEMRKEDMDKVADYYPILPTTIHFWDKVLRVVYNNDKDRILPNFFNLMRDLIMGCYLDSSFDVIPAEKLYFKITDILVKNHKLPDKIRSHTLYSYKKGYEIDKFAAKAVALLFLIDLLKESYDDIKITGRISVLCDLMKDKLGVNTDILNGLKKLFNTPVGCQYFSEIEGEEYQFQPFLK